MPGTATPTCGVRGATERSEPAVERRAHPVVAYPVVANPVVRNEP